MAFKPFEFFRRRKKLLLALITIMAMFVFVIGDALIGRPGGGGGLLGRGVLALFGYVPRDRVAVVAGSNLTLSELRELAARREGAYRLVLAVRSAYQEAILRKEANFTDEDFRLRDSNRQEDQRRFQERLENVRTSKPEVWRKLSQARPCMANDAVADFEIHDFFAFFQRHGRMPTEADYPLSADNLISFAWWKNRADQLGIVFSPSKVTEELLRVADDAVQPADLPKLVRSAFRRARAEEVELDQLLQWLGDEMRVMVAKGVVLGQQRRAGFSSAPLSVQATPLDLWMAYVDLRTQLEVGILSVPVSQSEFLKQVPDPTSDQVKEFYNKYRSQEPDPARDTPGFRIPELYQIEFVYADLDPTGDAAKYYRTWATAVQELDPLAFLASVVEFYLKNQQSRYRVEEPFLVTVTAADLAEAQYYRHPLPLPEGGWLDPVRARQAEAGQILLRVSGALSAAGVGGMDCGQLIPPLGRPVPRAEAAARELSALAGDVAVAAASASGPAGFLRYPPRLGYVERFVPLQEAYGGIVDLLTENQMQRFLDHDLRRLQSDLAAYGEIYRREHTRWRTRPGARADSGAKFTPPPFTYQEEGQQRSEPLDDYLKRFTQSRGLLWEGMKEPRAKADLLQEKGATPLNTLLKPLFFEAGFLSGKQLDQFVADQLTAAPSLFQARRVPDEQSVAARGGNVRRLALYWKRAEVEPRTPPLEEIYVHVLETWKAHQARSLAEAAARELAEQAARQGPDGYRLLRDCLLGEYTEKVLARFETAPLGVGLLNYRKAQVPTVEYPPDDFLDQVMTSLQQPGQTLVVANRPKSTYYVLFLRERKQPRASDPLDVAQFDLQVILPSPQRQIQVEGMPISEWVLRHKYEKFLSDWKAYFRDITRFNEELAKTFKSS
jgi:hypothetical protein